MASPLNLTTLATVKAWLGATNTNSDAMLNTLITAVSSSVLTYLQRPSFQYTLYTDVVDGWGTNEMLLRQWPVVDVSSVTIDGSVVPQAGSDAADPVVGWLCNLWTPPGPGQQAENVLSLRGRVFTPGTKNVSVVYYAGYLVSEEAHSLPPTPTDPPTVTADAPWGPWIGNSQVTYADGTPLTQITAGTPTIGQYLVALDGSGTYTFAIADGGADLLFNYSYCPADVSHVVLDTIGERYSYRQRFGVRSQMLAGQESMTYMDGGLSQFARDVLSVYQRRTMA